MKLFDGGATIVVFIFVVLIGSLAIDKAANNGKDTERLGKKIEKTMCGLTKGC
jgi:hypothetical protein